MHGCIVCGGVCIHPCRRTWRPEVGIKSSFFCCSSLQFLRQSLVEHRLLKFVWSCWPLSPLGHSGFATCPQNWGYRCVLPCLAFRRLMMVRTPPHVCPSSPLPTESSTVSQTFYSVIRTKSGQVAFESHCLSSPQQLSICLSLFFMTLTYLKHATQVCVENVAGCGFPSVFF